MNDPNADDRVQTDIEINYELETWEAPTALSSDALETALFNENIDIEGWTSIAVKSNSYERPAYTNFFSPPQGSMLYIDNDKTKDHNHPQSRLEWSDVILQVYQMQAAKTLQGLRKLRTIWRFWLNPDTSGILGEARTYGSPEYQGLPYIEYRPGGTTNDSGFFALLGCPNGSGIVRMLTDHCSA